MSSMYSRVKTLTESLVSSLHSNVKPLAVSPVSSLYSNVKTLLDSPGLPASSLNSNVKTLSPYSEEERPARRLRHDGAIGEATTEKSMSTNIPSLENGTPTAGRIAKKDKSYRG